MILNFVTADVQDGSQPSFVPRAFCPYNIMETGATSLIPVSRAQISASRLTQMMFYEKYNLHLVFELKCHRTRQ